MALTPRQPRYLFRIDDICDDMTAAPAFWRLMEVFRRHRVVPLVAVIPCNLDPTLARAGSGFRIEDLKPDIEAGALSVGLHGCHHRYRPSRECIWRLNDQSEFAGVPEPLQRERIETGLRVLGERLGLRPEFFVAPSHSYDHVTLGVLARAGLAVSDGIALFPFYLEGVLHVPAQLWSARERGEGLWTVMMHPQECDDAFIAGLDRFLALHREQVVDFSLAAVSPHVRVPWTRTMALRSQLFRRRFYLRWRLYRARRKLRRMLSAPPADTARETLA